MGFHATDDRFKAMQEPMIGHADAWERLSHLEKLPYLHLALRRREKVRHHISLRRAELDKRLAAVRKEKAEELESKGLLNRLGVCRFSKADLEWCIEEFEAKDFNDAQDLIYRFQLHSDCCVLKNGSERDN